MAEFFPDPMGEFGGPRRGRRRPTFEGADVPTVQTEPYNTPGYDPGAPPDGGGGGAPPPNAPPSSTPNYATVGPYANRLKGYNLDKLNDLEHDSVKYKVGRVQSWFDPAKGVTADFIKALNSIGVGQWGSSGKNDDRLQLQGSQNSEWGGSFGWDDVIWDFSGQGADPFWNAFTTPKAQAARQAGRTGDPYTDSATTPSAPAATQSDWWNDGLTRDELVRLAQNVYLGQDPSAQDPIGNYTGNGAFQLNDPRLWESIQNIATGPQSRDYWAARPDQQAPPPPPMNLNPQAMQQAVRILSMGVPQLMQRQDLATNPLVRWLMSVLGVAGTN